MYNIETFNDIFKVIYIDDDNYPFFLLLVPSVHNKHFC